MPDNDVELLASVLDEADIERAVDVDVLADMTQAELDYLAAVGDLADPVTDGVEGECV